jgi:hypothetical protein
MAKSKITHGVSWPNPALLAAARARAGDMGMSFSSYINQLVRRDLDWQNAFQVSHVDGSNIAIGSTGKVNQTIKGQRRLRRR